MAISDRFFMISKRTYAITKPTKSKGINTDRLFHKSSARINHTTKNRSIIRSSYKDRWV